jgi:hypothetical protein
MADELKRTRKVAAVASLKNYPSICIGLLRKTKGTSFMITGVPTKIELSTSRIKFQSFTAKPLPGLSGLTRALCGHSEVEAGGERFQIRRLGANILQEDGRD